MSLSSTKSSPEGQDSEHTTASTPGNIPYASQDERDESPQESVADNPEDASEPPLPAEVPPPLPNEAPPTSQPPDDDGWDPVWDEQAQAFYFYNRFTKTSQWENPRVLIPTEPAPPGVGNYDRIEPLPAASEPPPVAERTVGGYDPAIHGDYDPNADYAQTRQEAKNSDLGSLHPPGTEPDDGYDATGSFNRFTGKWQAATLNPENFNDDNKSRRQMNAYFDVDAAANSHDGKSLKAERSGKKLTKKELKAFKDKRRERKEEKRRAWLRD